MIEQDYCKTCGMPRLLHNGRCADCRDYAEHGDNSFLAMFLFVVVAGIVILSLVVTSQVYFEKP